MVDFDWSVLNDNAETTLISFNLVSLVNFMCLTQAVGSIWVWPPERQQILPTSDGEANCW